MPYLKKLLPGFGLLLLVGSFALLAGCSKSTTPVGQAPPPVVPVSTPVQREVTDYVDFTGRTDAAKAVDIRARVTGYLGEVPFKDGAEVKKGQLLFQIDQRPYEAQHEQAKGQVTLAQAQLKLAKSTYARDRNIASRTPGAISQQQLDQDLAAVEEGEARVRASQESMKVYALNVNFTRVVSPIDGQISRAYYSPGNLVNQDQTLLATVVSLDPINVYFDMDEPTLQRVHRAINEGKMKKPEEGVIPVSMGISGEEGFPHQGVINFINNQVSPTTGSISVRGTFPNPKPTNGVRLLKPGMFVRIHLPIGQPHPALLVIDRAISSDQGLKYLYVLDADNKAQYRRVKIGALQDDGLRVIEDGLKPDDRVVVGGLQQVRPRMVVQVEPIAMPTLGRPTTPEPAEETPKKEAVPKEAPKK